MRPRSRILIGLALLGFLVAWWAVGERRPAGEAAVARGAVEEPVRADSPASEVDAALAVAGDPVERERVEAASKIAPAITHRFTGRVVDETRHPVPNARVELRWVDVELPTARSGPDGNYTLEADLRGVAYTGRASMWARASRDRTGHVPAGFPLVIEGEVIEVELGPIGLAAAHDLRVRVVDGAVPVPAVAVGVALGHERNSFDERVTDARGEVVFEGLETGPVHLTARAPGREGRLQLFVPEEQSVVVELEPLGAVTVLVVEAESGAPVRGAELAISESFYVPKIVGGQDRLGMNGGFYVRDIGSRRTYRTDDAGHAQVAELSDAARYEMRVSARGYKAFPDGIIVGSRLKAGPEPVRVELATRVLRSVRWPLVAAERPAPSAGTPLVLRFAPGVVRLGMPEPELPGPARIEGGHVVVEGVFGSVDLLAETPDGALAQLWINSKSELGEEVAFHAARQIDVLVRDAAGARVAGARVIARDMRSHDLCPWAATDAEGRARLTGLPVGRAEVFALAPGERGRGAVYGSVDLAPGDAEHELTLRERRFGRARLAVRMDGEHRLPARYSVYSRAGARVVEELPGRGELVLEVDGAQPGSSTEIWLHAAGRTSARLELSFPANGIEAVAEVDLEPSTLLIAHITLPEGSYVELKPQLYDLDTLEWGTPSNLRYHNGLRRPNGPGGTFVFEGLSQGLWRVFDKRSELASKKIDLVRGEREVQLEFEL